MTLPTLFLAVGQCKSQTGLKLRLKRFAFFALDPTGYLHPLAMILQQMMLTLQNIQNAWVRLSRNKISNESPFGIFLLLLWVFFFWLAFGLVYFGLVFFFLFVCWFICLICFIPESYLLCSFCTNISTAMILRFFSIPENEIHNVLY